MATKEVNPITTALKVIVVFYGVVGLLTCLGNIT
jgi:hypothetical protein